MRSTSLVLVAAIALVATPALAGDCASKSNSGAAYASNTAGQPNLVETAVAAGSFNTLVAAVKAAGLADTLANGGPFTVFAPTDEAFAKLPEGTVDALLADPDKLRGILLYHVVPGKVYAKQVVNLDSATTAQGSDVTIAVKGDTVMVDDAKVVSTDIETSNGIIHVIDTVILPRG